MTKIYLVFFNSPFFVREHAHCSQPQIRCKPEVVTLRNGGVPQVAEHVTSNDIAVGVKDKSLSSNWCIFSGSTFALKCGFVQVVDEAIR